MTSEASCDAPWFVEEYERKEWSLLRLQRMAEFKILIATQEAEEFYADCKGMHPHATLRDRV